MVERGIKAHSIESVLTAMGRRVAVVSGALAALVSLIADAPVWVASARGAATVLTVLVLVRAATNLMARSEPVPGADVE